MNGSLGDIEILSVKEFTSRLKSIVEEVFFDVWITGEISNFKDHTASGHAYFSLKDEEAVVRAVLFKFNRLKIRFELENGLKVRAHGSISLYDKRGEYQIIIDYLEPEGMGALQLAFNQLKERLEKEGFFDPEHKSPIPIYPDRVGVVTSQTGAAIRDILNVMKRRFSGVDVFIYPTQVQGDTAANDIAQAIELANRMEIVDVLIVGRGGGSAEDLWAFNEEVVAQAIYHSKIPIISAVGHEVDFTISDYVADLRAPTPSAAAEQVVVSKEKVLEELIHFDERMNHAISYQIDLYKERLSHFSGDILSRLFSGQLTQDKLTLDHLTQRLLTAVQKHLDSAKSRFNLLHEKLVSLGPTSILKRGYSLVYLLSANKKNLINQSHDLNPKDHLEIQFYEGIVKAQVEE